MINLSQAEIDFAGSFIETNFLSLLLGDDNLDAIGLSALTYPDGSLDYDVIFIVRGQPQATIPAEIDFGDFRLKTRVRQEGSIRTSVPLQFPEMDTGELRPGMNVGGDGGSGTLGAIVNRDVRTMLLSCRHVLGTVGTIVRSPPRGRRFSQIVGEVVYEDRELDCALATISRVKANPEVIELKVFPRTSIDVSINDVVVKYGIATGKTFGIITAIKLIKKAFGFNCFFKKQFLIEVYSPRKPEDGQLSSKGDSGAPWFKSNFKGEATSTLLGIHTSGDSFVTDDIEYAFATEMVSIVRRFNIKF